MPDSSSVPGRRNWHSRARRYFIGAALLLLMAGVGLPLAMRELSLEFVKRQEEDYFLSAVVIGLVVAPFLLAIGLLLRSQGWPDVLLKLLLSGFLLVVLYAGMAAAISGMCVWTTEETLFVSRTDPDTTIARRSIGCGAVDSGPPGYGTFRITQWPPYFIRVTRIDVRRLDYRQWQAVNSPPPE